MYKDEYIVNDYLKLRLEGKETVIYVDDKPFIHCKKLLFNVPFEDLTDFDSVDQVLDTNSNINAKEIPTQALYLDPQEEFQGHCSNLHAWAEWEYNTNLLHSNLAFPLLKRLAEVGDQIARAVFKDEIIKRYLSGYPSVIEYLKKEHYTIYITDKDLEPYIDNAYTKSEFFLLISLMKEEESKIRAYKKLIELDPINKDAMKALAKLYEDVRDYENMIELYKNIIEMYPNDVEIHLDLSSIYELSSNFEKVIVVNLSILENEPDNLKAWENLARMYDITGNKKEKIEAIDNLKRIKSNKIKQLTQI